MTSQNDFESLPPSSKLILRVLENTEQNEVTRQELKSRTLLPDRTLGRAIDRLENKGLVDSRFLHEVDGRMRAYKLV